MAFAAVLPPLSTPRDGTRPDVCPGNSTDSHRSNGPVEVHGLKHSLHVFSSEKNDFPRIFEAARAQADEIDAARNIFTAFVAAAPAHLMSPG